MYKIGKIKTIRTTVAAPGEVIDAPLIVSSGSLDLTKYDDITSIESWNEYGGILCTDCLQIRDRIKYHFELVSWSGLTSAEKDIVISWYLKESYKDDNTSNTEKIMHLLGKGYSMPQAQGKLIQSYSEYHLREIDACAARANSGQLYTVIAKHLNLIDASDLIKITHKLFDLYKSQGIRGTLDGNAGEGLFDFLESTPGTSYETTGLQQQGYTLNTGTYMSFVSELMDVLRNGNY